MRRYFLLFAFFLCTTACMPTRITGRVSTATYTLPPKNTTFIILETNKELTLTERRIQEYISEKMISVGLKPTDDIEQVDYLVTYSYRVGPGRTVVNSSPDFVWGGKDIESYTEYSRYFHVAVIDRRASKGSDKIKIAWEGEVYSSGSSSNMSYLAPFFIDEIFRHFGKSTNNKRFYRIQ